MAINAVDIDAFVANLRNGLIEPQSTTGRRTGTTSPSAPQPMRTYSARCPRGGRGRRMVGTDLLDGVIRSRA
ncbi:hypothetical protein [Streptomyces sp. NPDC006691]|uniref:hypothetical protein n=1 Tax=Streptomyces sp. NPDC006691 TaxID=3364757 RepID=UPI003694708B